MGAETMGFDIDTLRRLTQADEPQIHRLLHELHKNLHHEQHVLQSAIVPQNLRVLRASLHRLKGAAVLIDARALACACTALDSALCGETTAAPSECWLGLHACIGSLCRDIEEQLHVETRPCTHSKS